MAVTSLGSFANTVSNPAVSITGNNTTNAITAGDKVVATLFIPNGNPTSISVTINGVAMTEIASSRATRSNKTIVSFYLDSAGMATSQAVSASWVNSGTQNGGGALIVLGALTPTNAFATGAPEKVATANGLSIAPATGASGTPSDTAANYFAWASLGAFLTVVGKETPDNSYTALTQATATTRTMVLDAAAKEFTSPPVATQTETWTIDNTASGWNGNHDWASHILLFKETVPGAPTNTAAATVSGTATVGSTLSTTDGTWTNTPTSFTYEWQRDVGTSSATWLTIAGATANTYVVTGDDLGSKIRSRITANNALGSSTPTPSSNATTVVPAPAGVLTYRIVAGPVAQSDAQHHRTNLILPVLPGDLMVLFAACSNAAITDGNGNRQDVGIVEDVGGHTWTQDSEAFNDTNIQHSAQAFSAQSSAGLAYNSTVTMTVHGMVAADVGTPDAANNPAGYHGQSPWWFIVAISTGDSRVVTLDQQAHNVDLLTTHAAPSITTTRSNAVVFGFAAATCASLAAAGWWTPAAGFTEIADTVSADAAGSESQYQIAAEAKVVTSGYTGTAGGTTGSNKNVTNMVIAYGAISATSKSAWLTRTLNRVKRPNRWRV